MEDLLSTTDTMDAITAKMCFRGSYLANLGIIDLGSDSYHPLDLVRMHPQENFTEFSSLYDKIERYYNLEIFKESGMALDKFLSMPTEFVDLTFRIVSKRADRASAAIDAETRKLKNQE